ncbi:MAG TPA: glycosyltransferase [Tepidisphaeraceae bacterium]|nr:glycosyltransferase [Tepidisphaeraceae bacterium]
MNDRQAKIGLVVIGRNEGERLRVCLESVTRLGLPIVYVDSGSTDESVALAKQMHAQIVELDNSASFSAARARNEGFARLIQVDPEIEYVQFVDGDCVLALGWVQAAAEFLDKHTDYAVVCGRRRERFPANSIYNRISDLEWDTPIGDSKSCGGDAMMRAAMFQKVNGFDPAIIAGEEPELCFRLRKLDWRIHRSDTDMTFHDLAMTRFGQWWNRSVRTGRGSLAVLMKLSSEQQPPFAEMLRSNVIWGVLWPLATLTIAILAAKVAGPSASALVLGISLMVFFAQTFRVASRAYRRIGNWPLALQYSSLVMIAKFAQVLGYVQLIIRRLVGTKDSNLHYKETPAV